MIGYLHHKGPPFLTESVKVKHEYADRYLAFYQGKWRRVYIQINRLYIVCDNIKIIIQVNGL